MNDAPLTTEQLVTLEAVIDRLVPSDEHGPGAREARVSDYVLRRLAGPYAIHLATYVEGLTRLDVDARQVHGCRFADLTAGRRDDLLVATEELEGNVDGSFFTIVLAHTMEGMFSDPEHGGNARFIGWNLIGYTGVRYVWTESDQQFGATIVDSDVNRSARAARAAMLASVPKTT